MRARGDDGAEEGGGEGKAEEEEGRKGKEEEEGGGEGKGKEKEGEVDEDEDRKDYRAGNCNDCNRQFCLDYNLPICKGAGVEDVFTTCFRESGSLSLSLSLSLFFSFACVRPTTFLVWARCL